MIDWLLTGSLRGSLIFLLVTGVDQLFCGSMRAPGRRIWWILVPLAFLSGPWLTLPDHGFTTPETGVLQYFHPLPPSGVTARTAAALETFAHSSPQTGWWLFAVWLAGAIISLLAILIPTWRTQRAWSGRRFSTDSHLLELLEDMKAVAGVTAPIGLIVSDSLAAPALLGWLRPRLLLPRTLAVSGRPTELKAIFLHELAHFRALDIPVNWLFILVRALHWFNPLAYAAVHAWIRFREEAADESAIRWLNETAPTAYGEILLRTLGQCHGGAPFGALAIGESLDNLKRRMLMIRTYPAKSGRAILAGIIAILFVAALPLMPSVWAQEDEATAKTAATAAMQAWLQEMDAGQYAKSWSDASSSFQKAVTSDKWVSMSQMVREPLGKLISREQVSALYNESIPGPDGKVIPGPFVIAQFKTSFENLKYAVETVTFDKIDGTWREAGYYIKPGT